MTQLTTFFKESDTSFGIFYPKNYIVATFQSYDATKEAAQVLRNAGFGADEVMALSGPEFLQYFEEVRVQTSLWSNLMGELSRGFGTEAAFVEDDVQRAIEGAGFLAVHSPTEKECARVKDLVTPVHPLAMHWYLSGGIQSLV